MTACCSAADVFLPLQVGAFPVLMSYGPYAKGLAFQEGFTQAWELMAKETPDRVVGPTNGWAGSQPMSQNTDNAASRDASAYL
jgi:hypothetical protein